MQPLWAEVYSGKGAGADVKSLRGCHGHDMKWLCSIASMKLFC